MKNFLLMLLLFTTSAPVFASVSQSIIISKDITLYWDYGSVVHNICKGGKGHKLHFYKGEEGEIFMDGKCSNGNVFVHKSLPLIFTFEKMCGEGVFVKNNPILVLNPTKKYIQTIGVCKN